MWLVFVRTFRMWSFITLFFSVCSVVIIIATTTTLMMKVIPGGVIVSAAIVSIVVASKISLVWTDCESVLNLFIDLSKTTTRMSSLIIIVLIITLWSIMLSIIVIVWSFISPLIIVISSFVSVIIRVTVLTMGTILSVIIISLILANIVPVILGTSIIFFLPAPTSASLNNDRILVSDVLFRRVSIDSCCIIQIFTLTCLRVILNFSVFLIVREVLRVFLFSYAWLFIRVVICCWPLIVTPTYLFLTIRSRVLMLLLMRWVLAIKLVIKIPLHVTTIFTIITFLIGLTVRVSTLVQLRLSLTIIILSANIILARWWHKAWLILRLIRTNRVKFLLNHLFSYLKNVRFFEFSIFRINRTWPH